MNHPEKYINQEKNLCHHLAVESGILQQIILIQHKKFEWQDYINEYCRIDIYHFIQKRSQLKFSKN